MSKAKAIGGDRKNGDDDADSPLFDSDTALSLLGFVIAGGVLVIPLLAIAATSGPAAWFGFVGVGLMVAFGVTVAGSLLGFLFGVPYTRDNSAGTVTKATDGIPGESDNPAAGYQYRPNTSLEQISDWLTKMIVGVGLVEVKEIPGKLAVAANFVSKGLGDTHATEVFAWAALIFFPVCGFLFGFLWARFNLRRLFSDADRELVKKLSRFTVDARAYALASQQLRRRADESSVPQDDLQDAVAKSSNEARGLILLQAKEVSKNSASDNDEAKDGAISVLQAIVAADKKDRHHEARAELSYALSRQSPADNDQAKEQIDEAIRIRDALKKTGWRYYEFRRARYRIHLNEPDAGILADLKAASTDTLRWKDWLRDNKDVEGWIKKHAPNFQIEA